MTHATAVQLIFFKTNKNLSQDLFLCSFFGLKSDKLSCFKSIFYVNMYVELFEEFNFEEFNVVSEYLCARTQRNLSYGKKR